MNLQLMVSLYFFDQSNICTVFSASSYSQRLVQLQILAEMAFVASMEMASIQYHMMEKY